LGDLLVTARKKRGKPAPKPSSIASAQRAAVERRLAREEKQHESQAQANSAPQKTGALGPTQLQARTDTPMASAGKGIDQKLIAQRDEKGVDGKPLSDAAIKIAGLASGLMNDHQKPLADPSLYGKPLFQNQALLDQIANARNQAQNRVLTGKGNAVYWGRARFKKRRPAPGRLDENGSSTEDVAAGDDIKSKDILMSWLSDDTIFNQIKKRMNDSGIAAQSYDDVAKLWEQVVNQAAATYSSTGKKVTPWALLALRGKNMVNGKPASKTTTATTIDEMDPANAKAMINKLASDALGREATPTEVEDFIAKAQTIVDKNPAVTQTTTNYDVTGSPTDSVSHTSGGMNIAMNRAQQEEQDRLNQSNEHADYQAAGVMMPWLEQALSSPF
jgi:hypothetical protein